MFNTNFVTPRNLIVIGVIATLSHVIAKPFYRLLDTAKAS